MAYHKADGDSIDELVVELGKITEFANELIADVQSIAQQIAAEWSGEASANYEALHAEWSDGASKMADGASKITSRAAISAQNYSDVAEHVKGLWA